MNQRDGGLLAQVAETAMVERAISPVGQKIQVRLADVSVEKGFIDFERVT